MTVYVLRATIICHEINVEDMNALAQVLGERATDIGTFSASRFANNVGHRFCIASTAATMGLLSKAKGWLEAPVHSPNADMTRARRAQSQLVVWAPEIDPETGEPTTQCPVPSASQNVAVVHNNIGDVLRWAGLTIVPPPQPS